MIAKDLSPLNLHTIAEDIASVSDEKKRTRLLKDLAGHPNAWPELQAWSTYCLETGFGPDEVSVPPVPEDFAVSVEDTPDKPEVPAPLPVRRKRLVWLSHMVLAACLVVALAGGAAYLYLQPESSPSPAASSAPPEPGSLDSLLDPNKPQVADALGGIAGAGDGFMCTAQDDVVRCVGQNDHGQLGSGSAGNPTQYSFDFKGAKFLTAGDDFACASAGTGVSCWGDNTWKQATDLDMALVGVSEVDALKGKKIASLSAGVVHACATTDENELFCWGSDWSGQLGSGMKGAQANAARKVELSIGQKPVSVVSSRFGSCVSTTTGSVLCWGANDGKRISSSEDAIVGPTIMSGGLK